MPTSGSFRSGVYDIVDPCGNKRVGFTIAQGYNQARCDMDSGNGGWLVIQRRVEGGTVDFNRDWRDYEEGFGDLEGEFWYGLQNIHCLTNSANMELRMDMEDESGNKITWTYQEFRVEGPENKYRLHIGGGEGTPGTRDHMVYSGAFNLNNMYFSTRDRDNDQYSSGSCAQAWKGGWWYNRCAITNPNGVHDSSADYTYHRVSSQTTGSNWVYYPNYEMKIRPKSCALTQTSDTCS